MRTKIVFFRESSGRVPFLEWLRELPVDVRVKCRTRLERLEEMGHELRRPEADLLRDGIHELRVRRGTVNYRILYFFHGRVAAVVSHGIVKEGVVPPSEIEKAILRRRLFEQAPDRHAAESARP